MSMEFIKSKKLEQMDAEERENHNTYLMRQIYEIKLQLQNSEEINDGNNGNEWKEVADGLRRELWIIRGALDHGIDLDTLTQVATTHKRAGVIPNGYYYPELFTSTQAPSYLKTIRKNKRAFRNV